VVSKDLDWERGAVEIVSPGLKGMSDGEEFVIINVIVLFCLGE